MQDGASVLRQQRLQQPTRSVQDRNEVKWHCEHHVAGTSKFDTLLWKIEFANVGQLHNDLRMVFPLVFQFQDKRGWPIDWPQVAPRMDAREIFQEVRITINGTLFSIRPTDFEHLNWTAQPAEDRMTRDINTKLPVALNERYHSQELLNAGFVKRARDFRNKCRISTAVAAYDHQQGNVYPHDLYLRLSHIVWKDWLRQEELNTQKAVNLFEMLVEVVFRKDISINDNTAGGPRANAVWSHCFDIGSELCYGTATFADLNDSCRDGVQLTPCTEDSILQYSLEEIDPATGNVHDYQEDAQFILDSYPVGAPLLSARAGAQKYAPSLLTDVDDTAANRARLLHEMIQFAEGTVVSAQNFYRSVYTALGPGVGGRLFYVHDVNDYVNHLGQVKLQLHVWGNPTHTAGNVAIIAPNTGFRIVRNYVETSVCALSWRSGDIVRLDLPANVSLTTRVVRTVAKNGRCRVYISDPLPGQDLQNNNVVANQAPFQNGPDSRLGEITNEFANKGTLSTYRLETWDYPMPSSEYNGTIASFYEAGSYAKYSQGDVLELIADVPASLPNLSASGFYEVLEVFEDNVVISFQRDATGANSNAAFPLSVAVPSLTTHTTQRGHFAGGIRVRQIKKGKSPVSQVKAGWIAEPYIHWERIKSQQALPEVLTFPLTETEVYRVPLQLDPAGALTLARMPELRVLTGWSRMYVYCSLLPQDRDLEYWTAMRNVLPRIQDIKLRVNEKYALKGTESRRWLWRRFQESTNADVCYQEWDENQCVICLRPEHLAYEDFFAGSAKLTTMGLECNVVHSHAWRNLYNSIQHLTTSLAFDNQGRAGGQFQSPYGANFQTVEYLRNMTWEMRIVFEYSRKEVQLASNGSVNVRENLISRPRDGMQLSTAVPRPIKVSGSHMEAYKK